MSNDYLWDRSGSPDPDTKQLEELLAPVTHDAPLDELRLAKGRRGAPVRATAHELVAAPPASGRVKDKMNFFDKRIIGAATLTTGALGLLGVTTYKLYVDSASHHTSFIDAHGKKHVGIELFGDEHESMMVATAYTFAIAPHAPPVAPTTRADLAITAGESAWIHVPFGAVDVEIRSKCNAEVEMSVVLAGGLVPGAHPDDPPTFVPMPAGHNPSSPNTPPPREVIAGMDSPDGRASTYHLTPEPGLGMLEYTSRCVGQPPMHGLLRVDRDLADEPIRQGTNAKVSSEGRVTVTTLDHGIHVFGTVLPGAKVSIGANQLALEPVDPTGDDPPFERWFSTDVPVSSDHLVAAVRVDDAHGTQFYVIHPSKLLVESCGTTITQPKQAAAKLDAQGDHAGALRALETGMAACKPDRDTLSLALTYACRVRDAEAARTYWHKLPPELQRTLEPMCAQNEITRAALDKP